MSEEMQKVKQLNRAWDFRVVNITPNIALPLASSLSCRVLIGRNTFTSYPYPGGFSPACCILALIFV